MATYKQVNLVLARLHEAGYSTDYMDSTFKALGATMRERSGSVEGWVKKMNNGQVQALLEKLEEGDE